jgi:hypothetical protein
MPASNNSASMLSTRMMSLLQDVFTVCPSFVTRIISPFITHLLLKIGHTGLCVDKKGVLHPIVLQISFDGWKTP